MDLLEAHVPESPCDPLLKAVVDCLPCQLPEPLEDSAGMASVCGPNALIHTHTGSAEVMQTHTYPKSETSEVTQPLQEIPPELEQTLHSPEDLTESFLDTIMCASSNNHNQSCLTAAPERLLCQQKVMQKSSSRTDDTTLFSFESSRESTDPDMSLYGDDPINTSQSEAEVTGCVQSDHSELFDLSLLSEAVDLQPPFFPSPETETNSLHVTQDDSLTEVVSDQSEDLAEPAVPTGPSSEAAAPVQEGHRSWSVCRDQQRARTLSLPISVKDIISMSVDAFNEAISTYELSDAQLSLMRDIRRRGKNKMAAQSCRKRKLDGLVDLEAEVEALREESKRRLLERERNARALHETREKLSKLYKELFSQLRDEHGNPYRPEEYTLQYSTDGRVFLLPSTPHANKRTSEHATKPH